jgi:3-deoxy-D-manno-octulosonic-acid transferase
LKTELSPAARLPLLLYNLAFPFVFLAMLPSLVRRMVHRGNFRRNFGQRFGRFSPALCSRLGRGPRTWIHSISVGETLLALKLARKMKELEPSLQVVLSVTTSTGYAIAEAERADWLEPIYNPLDALPFVKRTLAVVRPRRLIFIEAIWPNLLAQARSRGIPIALIPRLSPRSERRFRKARHFTGPLFRAIDRIALPEQADIARWESLGADPAALTVTGNIKFDYAGKPPDRLDAFRDILRRLGVSDGSPILLGGSTFPGEERILAEACRTLRTEHPDLFLIIVPRHVERTSEVAAELTAAGLNFALRTGDAARNADSLIVNTTGELRDWYHLATVVFIGKSLTATGGQNPVEAVVAGKPVLFGPHMENFQPLVATWLAAGAAIEVRDADQLARELSALLRDPARRQNLAQAAANLAAIHRGATERAARLLQHL